MNFGRIITQDCVNVPPPVDDRCSDPAFALANPDICPVEPTLVIKPGFAVACKLSGSIQFKAFIFRNGAEEEVTSGAVFTTSDPSVLVVSALTGSATGVGVGEATITVAYNGMHAHASMVVLDGEGENCCDEFNVAFMVLVDRTHSMSLQFGSGYTTKLAFARQAAQDFILALDDQKDTAGLMSFDADGNTVEAAISSDIEAVAAEAAGIGQTQKLTTFRDAFEDAVDLLDAASADRKVLVLISDGEDISKSYDTDTNPITVLEDFKNSGGIVLCLGVRSHGKGYNLLNRFASGGMMINAYPGNHESAITWFNGLRGYLCAGNCVPEGDYYEATGALDYDGFANWTVESGHVDLLGNGFIDLIPGNGLYVDMAGTSEPRMGRMVLTTPIGVEKDKTYRLALNVAGNMRVDADPYSIRVQVYFLSGNQKVYFLNNLVTIDNFAQGFQLHQWNFVANSTEDVYLAIQQVEQAPSTDTKVGLLVDLVRFQSVDDNSTLFEDTFDTENQVYIPPRCGTGTTSVPGTGYVTGYDCYGDGCLDEPPDAQQPDPNPLADIESGYTPPTIYTSTRTACAECELGSVNGPDENLVPAMTSNTTPSGQASDDVGSLFAFRAFTGSLGVPWNAEDSPAPHWLRYSFDEAVSVAAYGIWAHPSQTAYVPKSWKFQGSNDGTTWTDLDEKTNYMGFYSAENIFTLSAAATYKHFRIYLTEGTGTQSGVHLIYIFQFKLYGARATQVCKSATAESTISQADADAKAYAAAYSLALQELNCQPVYTSTQSYTATCPDGEYGPPVTKSATRTSLNSQPEADALATAAAREEALAELDCTHSNNEQRIVINDGSGGVTPATPYPSVKYVEDDETVGAVTVMLNGFSHTYPEDVRIALRSPSGTIVELMKNVGGSFAVTNLTLQIYDAAADSLPDSTIITTGHYKPTKLGANTVWPGPVIFGEVTLTTLAAFNGEPTQGAWSLWVIDVGSLDGGEIINGWDLLITFV